MISHNMSTIRYGIIGAGRTGQMHIRHIQSLPNTAITAIIEPYPEPRQISAAMAPNAQFFDTFDDMLKSNLVDILVIASPIYVHEQQLQYLTEHCDLPILVENPICTSRNNVRALLSIANNHPTPIWVAVANHYLPANQAVLSELKENDLGDIHMLQIQAELPQTDYKIRTDYKDQTLEQGTLITQCCHYFDFLRAVMGREAIRIYASGDIANTDVGTPYQRKQLQAAGFLDNAYIIVEFGQGQRAVLDLSRFGHARRFQRVITLTTSTGELRALSPKIESDYSSDEESSPIGTLRYSAHDYHQEPSLSELPLDQVNADNPLILNSVLELHKRFQASITEGAPIEHDLINGMKAVVLALAAQQSIKTGQVIDIHRDGLGYNAGES